VWYAKISDKIYILRERARDMGSQSSALKAIDFHPRRYRYYVKTS
jgi:hypothetical protein